MSVSWDVTIRGLQQALAANLKLAADLEPGGRAGEAIKWAAIELHRYAVAITHVDTGALRASHRIELAPGALEARIYLDPIARNPRSGQLTSVYGPYEQERGGEHAFYERTVDEIGTDIVEGAERILRGGLPS